MPGYMLVVDGVLVCVLDERKAAMEGQRRQTPHPAEDSPTAAPADQPNIFEEIFGEGVSREKEGRLMSGCAMLSHYMS